VGVDEFLDYDEATFCARYQFPSRVRHLERLKKDEREKAGRDFAGDPD